MNTPDSFHALRYHEYGNPVEVLKLEKTSLPPCGKGEVIIQMQASDVIPFPKTQSGMDPLTDAPSAIDEEDLVEYNLRYVTDE